MRPYIFYFGDVGVPSFFFMVMIGALAATFFGAYWAKREGADPVAMLDCGIIGVIAAIVGSRIFHILVENPSYYLEHPIRVFYFWQGGFVSIGAFTLTAIGWLIYFRWKKLDSWRYVDLATMSGPIIIFFVRVGCLLVGCCYGKPTDFPIHLTFHHPASVPAAFGYLNMSLHATQLYNMLNAIMMMVVFLISYKYRKFYGQIFATFFIYYGISRFFIEFLRGDRDRGLWFGDALSTGQISMMISFVLGVVLWIILSKRKAGRIAS
ncbi:MAG: prolipoprotein diacylglyceryl transferase [Deltaproteobacteria bacterium]|nr:prolipoprotein diacylglyceryl transferase [Deltaproteobacteria bacterium]